MYPLKMRPVFRHGKATPWGGRSLKTLYHKAIPDDMTGESLEISALPGMSSIVENGDLSGLTLLEVYEKFGEQLTGIPEAGDFPLLVKLLDAQSMLSVQVHPGDEYAKAHHGKLGKTEAWVVLAAPPGAKLVLGLKEKTDLGLCVENGTLENALAWLPVSAGDVLYIPHGLVHALGDGIVVYEIQQSSDVTYRLWDWNRVGPDGKKRSLHLQDAIQVARSVPGGKVTGIERDIPGGHETLYICDDHFELWRLSVRGTMKLESGRMRLMTAFGDGHLLWDGGKIALSVGDSVVIPAVCPVSLEGDFQLLMSAPSDRDKTEALLGDEAERVAGYKKELL